MKPITEEDIRADIVRKLPNENLDSYPKVIINLIFVFLDFKNKLVQRRRNEEFATRCRH